MFTLQLIQQCALESESYSLNFSYFNIYYPTIHSNLSAINNYPFAFNSDHQSFYHNSKHLPTCTCRAINKKSPTST